MLREILQTVESYFGEIFGSRGGARLASVSGHHERQINSCHTELVSEAQKNRYQDVKYFSVNDSSRLTSHSSRKCAFTLAEVLITLGIIGVVAALTMPTLISNNKKQTYVTGLKKAYSTLENGYKMMLASEGVTDYSEFYCRNHNDDATCFNNITKNFNVVKKFQQVYDNGQYSICSDSWCKYDKDVMTDMGFEGYTWNVFMTADGMTYMFTCCMVGDCLYVDVNGVQKSPNQLGRDIFRFVVGKIGTNALVLPFGMDNDNWKNCTSDNLTEDCTAKVIIEGKMNY